MIHLLTFGMLYLLNRAAKKFASTEPGAGLEEARFSWNLTLGAMTMNLGLSAAFAGYVLCRTNDFHAMKWMEAEYVAIQTFTTIGYGNYNIFNPRDYHFFDYLVHNLVMMATSVSWAVVCAAMTATIISVARSKRSPETSSGGQPNSGTSQNTRTR